MKAVCWIGAIVAVLLHAQSEPAVPKFDVVSIKPCQTSGPEGGGSSPGRLTTGCAILADTDNTGVIERAYNRYAGSRMNSFRIVPIEGGPDWIHSEKFQIDARSDGKPSGPMMEGPMMQTILEERFKLKIHRETRQGPVYELVLGKGSAKLKPLQPGKCTLVIAGRSLPRLAEGQRYCRNMISPRALEMEGGTLGVAASLLSIILGRPVIDTTGITGSFEIHLAFSLDDSPVPRPLSADPAAPAGVSMSNAPDIFLAIQEQLGLKLVPAKGPVEVLVIDHIERPSRN